MAWGFVGPSHFGKFFPDGDYVGWQEAIREHYDTRMTPEEKAARGIGERLKFTPFSNKFSEDLGPLADFECPRVFRIVSMARTLAPMLTLTSQLMAVNDALKAAIEGLEPGVHQFWPLQIGTYKGEPWPEGYDAMVVRTFLDAFVPEASDPRSFRTLGSGRFACTLPNKAMIFGLALSGTRIAGRHIWRDKLLREPGLYLSDALQSEIARRDLRVFKHFRLKEV